ncbi:non-symbiotic hemoglobin 2 [Tanacetum coccineum]
MNVTLLVGQSYNRHEVLCVDNSSYISKVVKESLLRTPEKRAGEKCCEEMKDAWSEACVQLSAALQAEMVKEAVAAKAEEMQAAKTQQ